jgi:formate dehydrogenase subunit delta
MHIETLVRMANDIGNFFSAESDKQQAARDIKFHIRRFWEPRMRARIIEHYREGGKGLSETVHAAIGLLAEEEQGAAQQQ